MKRTAIIALILVMLFQSCEKQSRMYHRPVTEETQDLTDAVVGKPLPQWQEGCLDMHHINSARGECTYYILPDGTTMLVDAGEADFAIAPKPSSAVPAYEVYGNYVKHFLPEGHTNLDYMFLTHFHIDHIGSNLVRAEGEGGYVHVGVSGVYDVVKFDRLIDRGYPSYEADPSIGAPDTETMPNYRKFVKKLEDEGTVKISRFEVGSTDQISMLYNPSAYKCKVTNIVGNGAALSKDGDGNPSVVQKEIPTSGNPNSCGFHIAYGNFDIIACGDLTGAPQNLMANNYYANYISMLEVFKANHHMNANSWGSGMKAVGFKAQVVTSVCNGAPDEGIVEHVLSLPADIFVTNLPQADLNASQTLGKIKGYEGHIVVRAAKGGSPFYVYVLDATDMSYNVKAIYGPYRSR